MVATETALADMLAADLSGLDLVALMIERFHQTEKKFLAKPHPAADVFELQTQLDHFVSYYNAARPHRALGRCTRAEVFDAKIKTHPTERVPDTTSGFVTTGSTRPAASR